MTQYRIEVTLIDFVEAEDADMALDMMLDLISKRDGMEIAAHQIWELPDEE